MSERIRPYGGSSSDRLTKLINRANNANLVEGIDFEYGEPVAASAVGTNTKVALYAKREGFRNHILHYRRLDIGALALLPQSEVEAVFVESWPVNIHSELEKINESLGLDLTPEEVVDLTYYDSGQEKIPLKISDKSLAWLPGEYLFEIRRAVMPLTMLLKITVLDGLFPPEKNLNHMWRAIRTPNQKLERGNFHGSSH